MLVKRHFFETLGSRSKLEAVLIWGPRQVGKTTLLDQLPLGSRVFLDDLGIRHRAQNDPALLLDGLVLPCLIDEAQYAPNLFPEIKKRIDHARRERLRKNDSVIPETKFFLTGSNKMTLDNRVKESLAGRCSTYVLHGLSVAEIRETFPDLPLKKILFCGGMPELYGRPDLRPHDYLNDYIRSYVEKDVALSAGITKIGAFTDVLSLLAARTGQFLNVSEIAGVAGVDQKTVHSWIELLERNGIAKLLQPFHTNLSKRIVKMPKFFMLDSGLCSRLQGHTSEEAMWNSPQSGSLFETMVFSELVKTRDNFLLDWEIFTWRTKEKHEIDFVLKSGQKVVLIESKMAIQNIKPLSLDSEATKVFSTQTPKMVCYAGHKIERLDQETLAVPVSNLGRYLMELF